METSSRIVVKKGIPAIFESQLLEDKMFFLKCCLHISLQM
jgi:hypothetical protein